MLRILTFLFAIVLASAAAATTLWVDAPRDGFLNLRTGPSTKYRVIDQMPHGSKVKLLHAPGKWYKVKHRSGAVGWAHSAFLSDRPIRFGHDRDDRYNGKPWRPHGKPGYKDGKPGYPHGKPGGHPHGAPSGPDYWVHAPGYSGLNLRDGPGSRYPVIMTMRQRDKVVVLGRQGKWLLVRHASGRVGWAHGNYLVNRYPGRPGGKPWTPDRDRHWDHRGHKGGKHWDRDDDDWRRKDHGWDRNRGWDHDGDHRNGRKYDRSEDVADAIRRCILQTGGDFRHCILRELGHLR